MNWLKKRVLFSFEHFRTLKRLRRYSRRAGDHDFKVMTALLFIGVALHTTSPLFWGQLVSTMSAGLMNQALIWIIGLLGLKIVIERLNYSRRVVRDRCLSKLKLYIGESFQEKFFNRSVGEHLREGTHLSSESMRKGEQAGISMEDNFLIEGYTIFAEFLFVITFLFILAPFAGVWMLAIVLINLVWNLHINLRVFNEFTPIELEWRQLGSFEEERIEKAVHVITHAQEQNTVKRFHDRFLQIYSQDHAFWKRHFSSIQFRDYLNIILWGALILYSFVLVRDSLMNVGAFLTLLLWSQSVMDKVWRMTELEARMAKHMAIVKQTLDDFERPQVLVGGAHMVSSPGVSNIAFEHVTFDHQHGIHTICDFNLTAQRGDRIALVGPSGSGKTTLMSLLLRHSDPTFGEIKIDGIPLRELSLRHWRRIVGLIPQQVDLLNGSVYYNLTFGIPDGKIEKPKILEIADHCRILEFGTRLTEGLDTKIGEDGVQLSGGQRQRLAWATAVLKDPSILIIDEGTSNLDALTEQQLIENLDRFCDNRITFIIAHRLATLKSCNRFVVIRPFQQCQPGQNQIETIAGSFEDCERSSSIFRAMLAQQRLQMSQTPTAPT